MSRQNFGGITALEYHAPPDMDFPDIVEEFDIASHALATQVRRLTWDGEDVAIIDRESVRIALGWLPAQKAQRPHYLVIAVGQPGRRSRAALDPAAYDTLLRRAVERVREYLPFDAQLNGPAGLPVGSALIDHTFDLLTATAPKTPNATRRRKRRARDAENWADGAVDPDEVRSFPRPASVPMRLTIITFGLTLFLHAPPVGAALLTYTTLREAQPLLFG
ncbi:hypothetical protein RA2_03252 [Roseovarius sp. A-2]|uniref:hypothetical protein n=1 Tax=Roseovarius sp. A-2 TaxID=1570360 RepID=UPI0009B57AD8|nr:hypothetical protein [Roseovarius sp. A-2]GAW36182.1 hypothetical protein RA2_03252 [Roseovarius sp. A-2]